MNEKNIDNDCPVWRTMQIMGSKWAMLILFHLSKKTFRYGELKRTIPQISEKVLNEELKILCTYQLVEKESYPEVPPRVEYSLTDLGKEALPIIEAIIRFGNEHLKQTKNNNA